MGTDRERHPSQPLEAQKQGQRSRKDAQSFKAGILRPPAAAGKKLTCIAFRARAHGNGIPALSMGNLSLNW